MADMAYIKLTWRCNQTCLFCSSPEREEHLTLSVARKRINALAGTDCRGVILTGGEPTLHEELPAIIRHVRAKGLECHMITNGQLTVDKEFVDTLAEAGLERMHVSLHSCRDDIQTLLTQNPESLDKILGTLENASRRKIPVTVNTVINAYNADHLDENVRWVKERFASITSFVWVLLDPTMNRVSRNRDTLPRFADFEISLARAMRFLDEGGLSFRVERVPLCYMAEYAHCAVETREIVKSKERFVHVSGKRGAAPQAPFRYGKAEVCGFCFLKDICAGLYEMDAYYPSEALYPVFLHPETIIEKI